MIQSTTHLLLRLDGAESDFPKSLLMVWPVADAPNHPGWHSRSPLRVGFERRMRDMVLELRILGCGCDEWKRRRRVQGGGGGEEEERMGKQ